MSSSPSASACARLPSPCLRRVKRLEHEGYIEAYRAMLGRDRIGLGLTVFVGVKIEGHADERAGEFEKAILAMPEIVACHMVSGEADYLLEVVVPDLQHYQRFLLGKLLDLSIVREVRSNIAIQSLKTAGALPLDHLGPPQERPKPRKVARREAASAQSALNPATAAPTFRASWSRSRSRARGGGGRRQSSSAPR